MSSWKCEKYNKKQSETSVNFAWLKISQKILKWTVTVDKFSNFFQNFY